MVDDQRAMSHSRSVILSGSGSCFVACPGCYNHFGSGLVATDVLVHFMGCLHRQMRIARVTVAGGDPLARPDIVALLQKLHAFGFAIKLDTVGTPLLGQVARLRFKGQGAVAPVPADELAPLVSIVGVPLDGSTTEINRRFRRFSSVDEQLTVIRLLGRAGVPVCVNTVVHAGNHQDLPSVFALLANEDAVQEWQLFQFMPSGPLGYRNRARYEISVRDFDSAVRDIDRQCGNDMPFRVTPKRNADRKHRYLLIDSDGVVWIPRQQHTSSWDPSDATSERQVLGDVQEPEGTLAAIAGLDA